MACTRGDHSRAWQPGVRSASYIFLGSAGNDRGSRVTASQTGWRPPLSLLFFLKPGG